MLLGLITKYEISFSKSISNLPCLYYAPSLPAVSRHGVSNRHEFLCLTRHFDTARVGKLVVVTRSGTCPSSSSCSSKSIHVHVHLWALSLLLSLSLCHFAEYIWIWMFLSLSAIVSWLPCYLPLLLFIIVFSKLCVYSFLCIQESFWLEFFFLKTKILSW